MEPLKPCPICGSKAEITTVSRGTGCYCGYTQRISVGCSNSDCKCGIKKYYDHEFYIDDNGCVIVTKDGFAKAAKEWNKRAYAENDDYTVYEAQRADNGETVTGVLIKIGDLRLIIPLESAVYYSGFSHKVETTGYIVKIDTVKKVKKEND